MGDKTKIEWADATWNPLVGCSKVSPGCDHCYAIQSVRRGEVLGIAQHAGLTVRPDPESRFEWTGEVRPVPGLFDQPSRWRRPRRIFVNSLSDLFHPDVLNLERPDGRPVLAHLVAEMVANPRHTFQVLTKRPQIMGAVLTEPMFRLDVNAMLIERGHDVMPGGMTDPGFEWPRHIWWGTSIESDRYSFRADHLRRIEGTRWISAEPLIGPLPSLDLTDIAWLVAGGESGPGARPMHPDWPRDLRDRCTSAAIPFVFKQWGSWRVGARANAVGSTVLGTVVYNDGRQLDWYGIDLARVEAQEGNPVVMSRAPKAETGRVLDGRTWDEYPSWEEQE